MSCSADTTSSPRAPGSSRPIWRRVRSCGGLALAARRLPFRRAGEGGEYWTKFGCEPHEETGESFDRESGELTARQAQTVPSPLEKR